VFFVVGLKVRNPDVVGIGFLREASIEEYGYCDLDYKH